MVHEAVNAENADVSSASVRDTFIPNIENNQHFSRCALSANGTSAFPAIADGLPELDAPIRYCAFAFLILIGSILLVRVNLRFGKDRKPWKRFLSQT